MFNSYPASDTAATVGRAALSIHLAMTFPLIFNALRLSVHVLFFARPGSGEMSTARATAYTLAIVPPLVALGTAIPEISTVFAFNGSLFGSLIVYIYPALMYMRLSAQPGLLWGRILPSAVAAFGVFLMLTGATVTALQKAGALSH
uniref:Amino acid transporter transmembrane domain-containing protein n=1 Tax=Tetraselmis chuii TaxID=63592 RepID=A0A7S1X8C9_9CHLO